MLMIMKYRTDSLKLMGVEAAIRRLSPSHPKYVFLEGLQRQIIAGIKGEELLNDFFERVKFRFDYYVLQDLHLYSTAWFQIDSLIVTPYYAIILEMKNIGGHIKIRKNHPQLERTLASDQIDYYKNPLAQVVEITDLLQDFFEMKNIELPIYQIVIFKDANRSLQFDETEIPIIGLQELPHYIRTRPRDKMKLNNNQMEALLTEFLNAHQDYNPFPITSKYFIEPKDIVPGVTCEKCHSFAVKKFYREWRCQKCGESTKVGHLNALSDFAMLIDRKITNKECRRFLQIDTCKQASKILGKLNVESTGSKKKREYILNYKIDNTNN